MTGIHHRAKREEATDIDHRVKCAKVSRIYHRALIPAVFLLALLYIGVSRITETQLFGGICLLSLPAIYGFILAVAALVTQRPFSLPFACDCGFSPLLAGGSVPRRNRVGVDDETALL